METRELYKPTTKEDLKNMRSWLLDFRLEYLFKLKIFAHDAHYKFEF